MGGALTSAIGVWATPSGIPGLPAGGAAFISTFTTTTASYIYSTDGVAWSVGTLPSGDLYAGAAFGGSTPLWVVMRGSTNTVTSPNGVSAWTAHAAVLPSGVWGDVAWSPTLGLFAALEVAGAANPIATSPDGLTWTRKTAPTGSGWNTITWSARLGLFIAVNAGFNVNIAMTSSDGVTWTLRTGTACNGVTVRDVGANFDVFGLQAGATTFALSADGTTWTRGTSGSIPGGGNVLGGLFSVGSAVYCFLKPGATVDLIKNTSADLSANWTTQTSNVLPGLVLGASQNAVKSAFYGLWAIAEGAANNTQVVTTKDALSFVLNNPTNAIASTLGFIAAAG